jgi:hypothetical protein
LCFTCLLSMHYLDKAIKNPTTFQQTSNYITKIK